MEWSRTPLVKARALGRFAEDSAIVLGNSNLSLRLAWPATIAVMAAIVLLAPQSTLALGDGPPVIVKPEEPPGSGSQFLKPPGSDHYGQSVDWADVPPWQQTSFFGIRARGRVFVYVVDCSGSMGQDDRLGRAKRELRRSISNLRFGQRFQVIFYNDRPLAMPGGIPQSADMDAKTQFSRWLDWIDAEGATDPRGALAQALSIRPDAVFLLSDGEFPEGTADAVAKGNTRRIPIHCVDLSGTKAATQLRRIAHDSGGQYAAPR